MVVNSPRVSLYIRIAVALLTIDDAFGCSRTLRVSVSFKLGFIQTQLYGDVVVLLISLHDHQRAHERCLVDMAHQQVDKLAKVCMYLSWDEWR